MSGGKGGSQTQSTEIPEWVRPYAEYGLNLGQQVQKIGYLPYYGADVAAFSPMQEQAFRSTGMAANAFGLGPQGGGLDWTTAGIAPAQTFAGGLRGYSSGELYDQALAELEARRPGQYAAYKNLFVDPVTGAVSAPQQQQAASSGGSPFGGNLKLVAGLDPAASVLNENATTLGNAEYRNEMLKRMGQDPNDFVSIGGNWYRKA